jgi:hypothetical protein
MAGTRIGRHLSLATRRELIEAIAGRYHAAARTEKKQILDEFIEVTNFHRKHAIRVLRRVAAHLPSASDAPRARTYDEAVLQTLTLLWEAADRICGKRLKAAIPALLDSMERHGHLKLDAEVRRLVLAASAATIDRMLACTKDRSRQGRRKQGVNTPLRKSIAVRTFTDWNDPPPGFFEMDMVAHCGKSVAGSHVHSLVLTDIASAWTIAAPMLVREQTLIIMTVEELRRELPFPLLGLDVDNDSAFINSTLLGYCRERGIELTRSRAYKKNDQAWIEQKNGSVVRRMVGYGRLEGTRAVAELAQLHRAARLYVNFFLPSFKLQSKIRKGARLSRKYDKPATPYERLLASDKITDEQKDQLRQTFATLDPIQLLSQVREAQNRLAQLEAGAASVEPPATHTTVDQFVRNLGTAWKQGEIRATHRKRNAAPRSWRTREDPFEGVWPTIQQWLNEKPDALSKDLFERLQANLPKSFQPGQLRTLQRRVKEWRTTIARQLVLGAETGLPFVARNDTKETVFD